MFFAVPFAEEGHDVVSTYFRRLLLTHSHQTMGQTLPCRRERCVVKVKLEDADCGLSIIKEEIKKEVDDIEVDPLSNHIEEENVSNHEEIDIEDFKLEVNDDHSCKTLPKNSIDDNVDNQSKTNDSPESKDDNVNDMTDDNIAEVNSGVKPNDHTSYYIII